MLFQQIRKLIVNDGAVGGVIMPEMLTLMHKFWVLKKLTFLHIFLLSITWHQMTIFFLFFVALYDLVFLSFSRRPCCGRCADDSALYSSTLS